MIKISKLPKNLQKNNSFKNYPINLFKQYNYYLNKIYIEKRNNNEFILCICRIRLKYIKILLS